MCRYGEPSCTWRFMGTYNSNYKSTDNLLRELRGLISTVIRLGFLPRSVWNKQKRDPVYVPPRRTPPPPPAPSPPTLGGAADLCCGGPDCSSRGLLLPFWALAWDPPNPKFPATPDHLPRTPPELPLHILQPFPLNPKPSTNEPWSKP